MEQPGFGSVSRLSDNTLMTCPCGTVVVWLELLGASDMTSATLARDFVMLMNLSVLFRVFSTTVQF